jgi:hypothetical protein
MISVPGDVVRLGRYFAKKLSVRVLPRVLELDLTNDRHPIVGDGRSAVLLLQDYVAALGAESDPHRMSDCVDPFLESLSGLPT